MTLGLPPAGIFWQPAEDSPSPNSLPSPLLSFVPRSCSAYLGASSWGGRHRALGLHCLTLRLSARCHPSLVGAAEPRNLILPRCCAHAARIPCSAAAAAAATPAGRLGFSFGPFFLRFFQNARLPLTRGRGASHPAPPGALPPAVATAVGGWGRLGEENETPTPRQMSVTPG